LHYPVQPLTKSSIATSLTFYNVLRIVGMSSIVGGVVLRRVDPSNVPTKSADPVDDETLAQAGAIVNAIKDRGESGTRSVSERAVRVRE
jgi:hypothetical protein